MSETELHGRQVIVISNAEPYKVGTFKKFWAHQPVVEIDGAEKIVLGIVFPYSEATEKLLQNMTHDDQWNWAADIVRFVNHVEQYRFP